MGNCVYCNEKVGLFKTEHAVCAKDAEAARLRLHDVISEAVKSGKNPADIEADISMHQREGRLTKGQVQEVVLRSLDKTVLEIAHNSPVDNEEIERIGSFFVAADPEWLTGDPMKRVSCPGFLFLTFSNTLYQVLHGQTPYAHPGGYDDFRFQEGEHPILRRYAALGEYRSIPNGRSFQSIGLPIGGGLYYRVGASQPRTSQTGLVPVDDGLMVITTKSIIYSGQNRNFRLPYSSILRLESFVDGFGVHENHGSGKVFIPSKLGAMDEGWYFSNLVSALMKWQAS